MKVRAIPHNSKCRYGERGAADAQAKSADNTGCLIEHFGNADAVPQLPERCLSRKAGIVRCCLRLCQTMFSIEERKNWHKYTALLKSN